MSKTTKRDRISQNNRHKNKAMHKDLSDDGSESDGEYETIPVNRRAGKRVSVNRRKNRAIYDSDDDRFNSDESDGESNDDKEHQSGGEGSDDHLDLDEDDNTYNDEDSGEYDPVSNEEFAGSDEGPSQDDDTTSAVEDEDDDEEKTGESKTCYLKNINKKSLVLDDDDSNMYGKLPYTKIADEDRCSGSIMTYYEMVRIIGTRAQQFNFGAKPLVTGVDDLTPAKMAYIELFSGMTPFIIRRHLPGKKYEEWKISELKIIHTIDDDMFVPENFNLSDFLKANKRAPPHK